MTDETTEALAANVVQALCRVMRDLPSIGKGGTAAPNQGGYRYRGIDQITPHTQELFARHCVLFTPRVVSYELRELMVNAKPWTDVVEMIEYDVRGPGGADDKIVIGPILAIGRDNSDKGSNKCLTQAMKYALLQTFQVSDPKDDADGQTHEADSRPAATGSPADLLGDGELLAADAKARLLTAVEGDKTAATQAWHAAGLDGKWKVTAQQLADVITEATAPQFPVADDGGGSEAANGSGPAPDATQVPAGVDIVAELDHEYGQLGVVQRAAFDAWCRKTGLPEARADASRADVLAAIGKARELRSHTGPIDTEEEEQAS